MSTIAEKLTQLSTIKGDIKTAINNKGGSVGDDFSTYATAINNLSTGSGKAYVNPDFYEVRTQNGTNYDNLFESYNGPNIDLSKWDTSKVTSMQHTFDYCRKSMDISKWDLSSLTNASYMFNGFENGGRYIDLSVLDFSNISNANSMFSYSNTTYLDVRNINLTGTTGYNSLFNNCLGTELDLSAWDVSKITDISSFTSSAKFKKINLTGWNTVKVTNMNYAFYYMTNLETLLMPDWDMTKATSTSSFMYNVPKLKYIDLSRSNDLTIKKIASFLPTKTATTYGEMLVPADTSQDAIDALLAIYWKPVGPKFDLNSTELVFELDEIKPGKTTKVYTSNNDPWYGDDRLETIEFVSSNESIATVNGREITGVTEGTVDIICRRRADSVVLGSTTLTVSKTDSNPNLIKFRTNGSESSYYSMLEVNGKGVGISSCTKDPITGIYSYDPGKQITSITFNYNGTCYINEIVKFNFNESNVISANSMFQNYKGTVLDLSDWNTNRITNYRAFINGSPNLIEIKGELDFSNVNDFDTFAFSACPNLESLYLKNIYKNCTMTNATKWSINLGSTKIKDECLIYIINALPDLINDKGLTATSDIKLTLPPTNTLTAEQVQPAIDKGWTVVNTTY